MFNVKLNNEGIDANVHFKLDLGYGMMTPVYSLSFGWLVVFVSYLLY